MTIIVAGFSTHELVEAFMRRFWFRSRGVGVGSLPC